MYDCSSEITKFHDEHVRLSKEDANKLAGYRETNKERLESGLSAKGQPLPVRFFNQGSYAMDTINQHPDNDYDIDVGVVFDKEDLVGKNGAEMTALDVRNMVCEALQDEKFKTQPEVTPNCVRVYYNEGHHIDMPLYRQYKTQTGDVKLELAGPEWKESHPEGVTTWFTDAVKAKSPDTTNGRQMRRIVRLIKKWATSRKSWNMPSGFIISKLVDECYYPCKDRDDEALVRTLQQMKTRFLTQRTVSHPVLPGVCISDGKEAKIEEMVNRLEDEVKLLEILFDPKCTRQTALKAWKEFFNDFFFSELLKESCSAFGGPLADGVPTRPVDKRGEERFA